MTPLRYGYGIMYRGHESFDHRYMCILDFPRELAAGDEITVGEVKCRVEFVDDETCAYVTAI